MAEYELIQERLISGKGVLIIPDDKRLMRHYVLYANMIRIAKTYYASFDWNPGKGLLARLMFERDGYLVQTGEMVREKQSWDWVNDPSGQTMIALKCAYEGTLQSFANIATAEGLTVVSVIDLIKNYENLATIWNRLCVGCTADFAIQLRLYGLPYDYCDGSKNKSKIPTPPPPPLPLVSVGTPIGSISLPYDADTNDNGRTSPYSGDFGEAPAEEPPGVTCVAYEFDIYVKLASNSDYIYFNHYIAYGQIEATVPASPGFFDSPRLKSRGSSISSGNLPEACGDEIVEPMGAFIGLQAVEIRNFTPYVPPP